MGVRRSAGRAGPDAPDFGGPGRRDDAQPQALIGAPAGAFLAAFLARTMSLVRMWARADGERRLQLQPFVIAAGGLATWYLVSGVVNVLTSWPLWDDLSNGLFFGLTLAAIPTALAMAVLRHGMYGIEVLVNRAAVATLVSVILFGVYAAIAGATAELSGNGQGLDWGPVLAAGAVLALLAPVHRFASTSIDRVMFGDRDRTDRAMEHLADRLGEAVDLSTSPRPSSRPSRTPCACPMWHSTDTRRAARRSGSPWVRRSPPPLWPSRSPGPGGAGGPDRLPSHGRIRSQRSRPNAAGRSRQAERPGAVCGAPRARTRRQPERLRFWVDWRERAHIRRALHDSISPTLAGVAIAASEAGRRSRRPGGRTAALGHRTGCPIRNRHTARPARRPAVRRQLPTSAWSPPWSSASRHWPQPAGSATGSPSPRNSKSSTQPLKKRSIWLPSRPSPTWCATPAHTCTVSVARARDMLELQVTDDGRGRATTDLDGDGLNSARDRILVLGGDFYAAGDPAGGFRVHATVPQEPTP